MYKCFEYLSNHTGKIFIGLFLVAATIQQIATNKYKHFEGYRISIDSSYNDVNRYTLERPDGLTCILQDFNKEVLISQTTPPNFPLINSANANPAIIPILNRKEKIGERHRERLQRLTLEERKRISEECVGVLEKYLQKF